MTQQFFAVEEESYSHARVMNATLGRIESEMAMIRETHPNARVSNVSHSLSYTAPIKFIASSIVTVDLD